MVDIKKIVIAGGTVFMGQELGTFPGDEIEIVVPGSHLQNFSTNTFSETHFKTGTSNNRRFVKWYGKSLGE